MDPDADAAIARFFELSEARRYPDGKQLNEGDIRDAHHLRVESRHGVIDIMRGGLPPLDYETASARAVEATWRDQPFRVAALRTLVGFKRLAGRGQDRVDLENLENANGELPIDEIPGLDT